MLLSNPERIAIETVAAALEPPPALDLLDWAERNIAFDDGPFPGPYSRALFPFFDEVLRALGPDDSCRIVSFVGERTSGQDGFSDDLRPRLDDGVARLFHGRASDARQCDSLVEDETCANDPLDADRARAFSSARQ